MTIQELIKRANDQSKTTGFWDAGRSANEALMLVAGCCGKAFDSYNDGERWRDPRHIGGIGNFDSYANGYPEGWSCCYDDYLGGTFEDALADIVIRIADLCGRMGIVPDAGAKDPFSYAAEDAERWCIAGDVASLLFGRVVSSIAGFDYAKKEHGYAIHGSFYHTPISSISIYCKRNSIDLVRHIELRLAYNDMMIKKTEPA